jgi:hypothetical protein
MPYAPALRHCRHLNPHVAAGLAGLEATGAAAFVAGPDRYCSPRHRNALCDPSRLDLNVIQ